MIYIGRLPHGFYEEQIKKYFSQFGEVVNVRVSRNKKVPHTPAPPHPQTGHPRHYAFVQFTDPVRPPPPSYNFPLPQRPPCPTPPRAEEAPS